VTGALAVVGGQRVLDARHDAADSAVADRYADALGVVEPFDESLHAEPGPDAAVALDSTVRVGGTVVGLKRDGTGWHVVGLEPDDWSTRWSTGVELVVASPDDRPYWLEDGTLSDFARAAAGMDVHDFVSVPSDSWCTAAGPDRTSAVCGIQTGGVLQQAPLSTTWWLVDVTTGDVLRTFSTVSTTWIHPVGDVLVHVRGVTVDGGTAGTDPPVGWEVEGTDPRTGEVRWTWAVAPSDDTATPTPWLDPSWPYPEVTYDPSGGGRVLIRLGATAWLLGVDGTVLDEVTVADGNRVTPGRNGRVVPDYGTVTGDDGLVRQEQGFPVPVDDGSLADVAFVSRSELAERELYARGADGADRWGSRLARIPLAVLDGDVLVRTFSGVARLDGTDGAVVWSVDVGADGDLAVTDGRTVLVRVGSSLRAMSWSSGVVRWERPLADLGVHGEVHDLGVAPGLRRLVASVDTGTVVLR
jgi:hypothetical protein